jgi:lipid II isoglutaminyl synthase (glutamine-hydrolysing)
VSAALRAKLVLARLASAAARLRGGGTSLPGKLLLRLQPDALALLAARLPQGSAVVSATNGKTTTTAMAARILQRHGMTLVHNQAGANMPGGIASTLLSVASANGRLAGEIGLFEADEFWLEEVVHDLHPRAIVLANLFRDQLDRYGELDAIAERWGRTVCAGAGRSATLVCNADDPVLADLGREREGHGEERTRENGQDYPGEGGKRAEVVYFGVQDQTLALPGLAHAADAKHCRRCGAPYVFDAVLLGHLGHYRCLACGQQRPSPTVSAHDVTLEGLRGSRFRLHTPQGQAEARVALPGLYNVYNALAAAALAVALGVPLAEIVEGLAAAAPAFGRGESVQLDGRELRILLVKNPAGANEVLRTLALEPGQHDLLCVLNDQIADGRDVSWIWDADFELLGARVRHVLCSGTRAPELALRLKYAGIDPARIRVVSELDTALTAALGDRPVAPAGSGGTDGASPAPLYALPTYTAMLALRELLVKRGEAHSSWS